ncbi:MAG: hypothetical protein ACRDTJ_17685 [Pseudonocardiaceae bacterium]
MVDTRSDADGALALLREILADLPRLPGASCVGRHELYDAMDIPGVVTRTATGTKHASEGRRVLRRVSRPSAVHHGHY